MAVKKTIKRSAIRRTTSTGGKITAAQANKLVNELKRSKLINLDAKISTITPILSKSALVSGYVLAWDNYVLVTPGKITSKR